ncbi:histone deacetylase [Synechococcus sp. PCC 7336]|uniref:histone deacetylase family protein n=1 Tax=Synechococcus sp. PCC 7336 TaxID=195250 RepID=UPI0003470224|nr:histone deacetylase [Synechococcus sp. PCC 7336]
MPVPIVYHSDYVAPLPDGHRFPMPKFQRLFEMLQQEGIARQGYCFEPEMPSRECLQLVHDPDYVAAYCDGRLDDKAMRRIGLPWSESVVRRTCRAIGGTILTARLALDRGLACNTAGGTHHAFPDYGSGFCIFNDLAVATRVLQRRQLARRILIVDLDVHQGDGTAVIFHNDPSVFTFSMHCQDNFPGTKQQSSLDVPLPVGMEDEDYLQTLAAYLPDVLADFKPDLVLFDAGVDPHVDDRLGKLALTDTGIYRREMQVLNTCVGAGYPVAAVIGGGYASDIASLVYRHSLLHRAADEVCRHYGL